MRIMIAVPLACCLLTEHEGSGEMQEESPGRGDIEGEKTQGVSRSGSEGLRGFESHPPHQFTGKYE
jgi:hypothetical protein